MTSRVRDVCEISGQLVIKISEHCVTGHLVMPPELLVRCIVKGFYENKI